MSYLCEINSEWSGQFLSNKSRCHKWFGTSQGHSKAIVKCVGDVHEREQGTKTAYTSIARWDKPAKRRERETTYKTQ